MGGSALAIASIDQFAPLALRRRAQILIAQGEHVPADERRRSLFGEHAYPRFRRVYAQQQRLELESVRPRNHDLTVDDATFRQVRPERGRQLGKVSIERLEVATLDEDRVAIAEDDRPEAVPLGLEEPAFALGSPVATLASMGSRGGWKGSVMARV